MCRIRQGLSGKLLASGAGSLSVISTTTAVSTWSSSRRTSRWPYFTISRRQKAITS